MSTNGDSAARAGRSDAGGGNGRLKGLAFKAGHADLENSSTAWLDKIVPTVAAPCMPPATKPTEPSVAESGVPPSEARQTTRMRPTPIKRAPPRAPAGTAMHEARHRHRSHATPYRASRLADNALLAAVWIFVAAAGWRFSSDHLSVWIEAIWPSAPVAEQQQASRPSQQVAQASERAPERVEERVQEPARPAASEPQPAIRADAAPTENRNAVVSASAGAELAPTQPMPAPASDVRAEPVPAASAGAELAPTQPMPAPATDVRAEAVPAAHEAAPPAPSQAASPEATRLLARARLLLELGDIVTARVALERATESGSPIAAFALAETYDPAVLSAWGAVGTRSDSAKARQLYATAAAGGVEAARDRLDVSRQPIGGEARQ